MPEWKHSAFKTLPHPMEGLRKWRTHKQRSCAVPRFPALLQSTTGLPFYLRVQLQRSTRISHVQRHPSPLPSTSPVEKAKRGWRWGGARGERRRETQGNQRNGDVSRVSPKGGRTPCQASAALHATLCPQAASPLLLPQEGAPSERAGSPSQTFDYEAAAGVSCS